MNAILAHDQSHR